MTGRHRGQRGFTLIEIVIGLVILTLLVVVMGGTFLVGFRTISQQAREISADQAFSSASIALTRDLTSASTISTGTITRGAGTLQYRYGSPLVTVTYSITNNGDLQRQVGAVRTIVARGLQQVTVAPPGAPPCYLTITIVPSAVGASAQTLNVSLRLQGCF